MFYKNFSVKNIFCTILALGLVANIAFYVSNVTSYNKQRLQAVNDCIAETEEASECIHILSVSN